MIHVNKYKNCSVKLRMPNILIHYLLTMSNERWSQMWDDQGQIGVCRKQTLSSSHRSRSWGDLTYEPRGLLVTTHGAPLLFSRIGITTNHSLRFQKMVGCPVSIQYQHHPSVPQHRRGVGLCRLLSQSLSDLGIARWHRGFAMRAEDCEEVAFNEPRR
jgi:hypothetical protein